MTFPRSSSRPGEKPALLQCPAWVSIPWLLHGFSTRQGGASSAYLAGGKAGDLNLGFSAVDSPEIVAANRAALVQALVSNLGQQRRTDPYKLITLKQTHSAVSHPINAATQSTVSGAEGDGLMTDEAGLLLAIQTADCVPLLVIDPAHKAVAAFHAGWRGTFQRIVESGIARMMSEFSSSPGDLLAAIGPCIRKCCYAVGEDLRTQFRSEFTYADELFSETDLNSRSPAHLAPAALHLDLVEANRRQLLTAGLPASNIFEIPAGTEGCTSCHPDRYFSYRRSNGHTGRMMSVVGIRQE